MKAANKSLAGVVMVESDLGMGSGFFIARDKIATNIHVVAHGDISITRVDDEMRWEVAGVTAFDVEYDTIILKVREESSPLLLGNSDAVKLGDEVTVVGCSDGKYSTVPGVIHSLPRSDGWILIGAGSVIFHGNSGGPVLNSENYVIGIVCVGNDLGTAVAIPINRLMTLLRRSGSSERLAEWHKRDEIQAYVHLCQGQAKMRQGEKRVMLVTMKTR